MSPQTTAALVALQGKSAVVVKGCPARGIRKGDKARNIEVHHVVGLGYRVHFKVEGVIVILWAASASRFKGGKLQLNTGNPTQRVVLALN